MSSRKFLSLKQKSEIVEQIGKGVSVSSLAKKYEVAKSTICGINKKRHYIISHQTSGASKRKTLRKGEYPRMEKALYNWFVTQRKKNCPVSGEMLKEKAKKFHADIKETVGRFNASSGWLSGFKSRFGIRLLKVSGEKLSSDTNAVNPFKHKVSNIIYELKLSKDQIYNADETGLFWKMLPDRSYVSQTEKTAPERKAEKARITFLACTNATGQHKIKPLIIGRAKKPRSFKAYDIPVDYRNSKSAWMTADIFRYWFHHCFVPQVQKFLRQKGLETKAVLLLDNAPCHPPENELKTADGSIFVIYMPPNVTPLIQPMDQNVIRLTKLYYKKHLLLLAVGKDDIAQFLKTLTLKDAVSFLMLAWNQLEANVISKCWKPLLERINETESNQSEDEDDDVPLCLLRQQILQAKYREIHDIQSLLQVVIPEETYTEIDIENWNSIEDGEPIHFGKDDENIAESDKDDQNEIEITNPVKATEAIECFDKAIAWAEDNTTDYTGILALQSLREKAIQKSISIPKKQRSIREFFQ